MRTALCILFAISYQAGFGQIIYEPIFINQCTNEVEKDVFWYLTDSSETYGMENFESKPISLPRPGKYNLHFNISEPTIKVKIIPDKVNRDTILLKRLELAVYVSNPPHSEYLDCGNLANGKITDLYDNGNLRTKGIFKDGQLIDTLFNYHRNGTLSKLFIPGKENWKEITYYNNGNLQSVYDTKKRYNKEFYQNGQLRKEENWSIRYNSLTTEYYENGNVSRTTNKKEQKRFSQKGTLIEKIRRKEISVIDRIFAKNHYDRHHKFYEYKWETFDENGTIKRRITFYNEGFLMSPFPDSIEQIDDFLFDKVTFYKNGAESIKIEFEYISENNENVKKLHIFRREDEEWIEEKATIANNLYKIIATHSR